MKPIQIARKIVQLSGVVLYLTPLFGFTFFLGNLSSTLILNVPFTDPLAAVELLFSTKSFTSSLLISSFLVFFLYLIVGGRVFCSWACPIHLITEVTEIAGKKLDVFEKLPPLQVKWITLAFTFLFSLLLSIPVFEVVSPIGIFVRSLFFGIGSNIIIIIGIILLEIFLYRRVWCRTLCPLGGFYSLIGRFSPLKVKFYKERCTHCYECKKQCLVEEVLDPSLERGDSWIISGECTNCGYCISDCPTKALKFGIRNPLGK